MFHSEIKKLGYFLWGKTHDEKYLFFRSYGLLVLKLEIFPYIHIMWTTSIRLLLPEHGFCWQNGPGRGQVHDWYPIEKLIVAQNCLDDLCCSSECVHSVNKDEVEESLFLLAFRRDIINAIFLKYSKEGRSSSSDVPFRNITSDACYANSKQMK